MNESLGTRDGRKVLFLERRFAHPVEKVWRAITDPAELRYWFPSEVALELRIGGTIRFLNVDGEGLAMEGRILDVDPPRLFCFEWGDSVLRFELRPLEGIGNGPDGAGCVMSFHHTFDDQVSAASYAAGWHICFQNLYLVLDGKPADVGLDQWAAMHDGYITQFGLDAGAVAEPATSGAPWVVHFERQLTRPVEEVWQVLSGGRDPEAGAPAPAAFLSATMEPGGAAATVTEVEPPELLEYRWDAEGSEPSRVRWFLAPGNGGARLDLTQMIPSERGGERHQVLRAWAQSLESLAQRLRQ